MPPAPNQRDSEISKLPTWVVDTMEDKLTINKAYAAKYQKRKQAEELSRLRDKYGDVLLEDESSSSDEEEEDENAELLTAQVEKDFLRTLSLIRSKDLRIYDKGTKFFENESSKPAEEGEKVDKPMYLRDYERKQLLERGAMAGVSDSEEEEEQKKRIPPTYNEEQQQLKESFKRAVEEERLGDSEDEDLLKLREKSKEEREEEERDYVLWLKGERAKMAAGESDLVGLREVWVAPDLDPDEAFLRDYILNQGYVDKEAMRLKVPTYHEVVGGSEDEGEEEEEEEEVSVSEDEDALTRQEDFERKYNFRFEEPGGDQVTTYPRNVTGSVRREDDRRKVKRKQREERKVREKEQKEEELKRLKKLKREEIQNKLEKIKSITGNPNVGFTAKDLEGDFDPDHYDTAMATAFNDDYYAMEGGEEEKPVFSDEDDDYPDWDHLQAEDHEPHCEDPDFNMDADYDPQLEQVPTERSKSASLKRKHKLAVAVAQKKPLFDPSEKTFEQYFDEYYHLDYEDLIGDMPCRFKYRQVPSNSFGLSVGEVLSCDDKELNQWVSLKKSVQIRTEEEEEKDKRAYKKKARNLKRKYQILTSLKETQEEEAEQPEHKKRRKRHQPASESRDRDGTRKKIRGEEGEGGVVGESAVDKAASGSSGVKSKGKVKRKRTKAAGDELPAATTKRLKHRKKHKISSSAAEKLSSARLKSYGF